MAAVDGRPFAAGTVLGTALDKIQGTGGGINPDDGPAAPNAWLFGPPNTLLQYIVDEQVITSVTHRALLNVRATPLLLAIAREQIPNPTDQTKDAWQQLINLSAGDFGFAEEEAATGFNTLFSHAAVGTWGAIETSIENTLLNHIRKVSDVETVIRTSAPTLKDKDLRRGLEGGAPGALLKRWEGLLPDTLTTMGRQLLMLQAFGLYISLKPGSEQLLSELAELRNVILHRGGVVDQRFKDKCPWRPDEIGDRMLVSHELMGSYFEAAGDFAVTLIGAVAKSPYIYTAPS
jgi:hypothetical protein